MFLLDDLLAAPGKAVIALFEELAKKAQEEFLDDDSVKKELQEIYALLDSGRISEGEFESREHRLLDRLEQIARAKFQEHWSADAPSAMPAIVEASVIEPPPEIEQADGLEVLQPEPTGETPAMTAFAAFAPLLERLASSMTHDAAPLRPPESHIAPVVRAPEIDVVPAADSAPPPFQPSVMAMPPAPAAAPAFTGTASTFAAATTPPLAAPVTSPAVAQAARPVLLTMPQVVEAALGGLSMLKLRLSSVTSVIHEDDGWHVSVEVVERRSVPDTSDLLGIYELHLDEGGNILRYERTRMRRRCDLGR